MNKVKVNTKYMLGMKELVKKSKLSLVGKSKLHEQEDSLKEQIARESAIMGNRLAASTNDIERGNITAAINLLTQALFLANDQSRASRRLLNVAKRLSRKK